MYFNICRVRFFNTDFDVLSKKSGIYFQMNNKHFIMFHKSLKDLLKKCQRENCQTFIEINSMSVDKLDLHKKNERELTKISMI